MKMADCAAATAQSAILVPLLGKSDCACHLGGCLLAHAPDRFYGCCRSLYETCFCRSGFL